MADVNVGLIGSQFISEIHAESLKRVPRANVVGVASPTVEHVTSFAERHGIPNHFTDYCKMLAMDELDLVILGLPNDLHAEATIAAAEAGKHVICEKPLCLTLADADAMIDACDTAGVKLMYAEELCFAPKYVRLKELADEGALGELYMVKQSEKHDGPHAAWFWDADRSGGGVTLDMGCHAFQFFRWMLPGAEVTGVYADMGTYVHGDKTRGDDNAVIIVNFSDGATCIAEESWAKPGGMDDRAEVYGSEGVAYADVLYGNSIRTYSKGGYGYAVEKAGSTSGWTFTMYEEAWNYGFPQELEHFVDCVADDMEPLVTGRDGREVLRMIFAAYESAGTGRKVEFPYTSAARRPIDLWRPT
jgi:myo-inositol 2-dehydrogenase/D-chiro-inositol 1-dehydrogenase